MQETQKMQEGFLRWGDPEEEAEQLTPVFLPGESHGQRSLQATVQGVAKSQTQLNQLSMYACMLKQTLHDRLCIAYIASHLHDIYENKTI